MKKYFYTLSERLLKVFNLKANKKTSYYDRFNLTNDQWLVIKKRLDECNKLPKENLDFFEVQYGDTTGFVDLAGRIRLANF